MRKYTISNLLLAALVTFLIIFMYGSKVTKFVQKTNSTTQGLTNPLHRTNPTKHYSSIDESYRKKERITISIVVCDKRYEESLNSIKSALLFTHTPIYYIVFIEDNLRLKMNEKLNEWKQILKGRFDFELQKINFPEKYKEVWINLFKKCSSQRLFIPSLIHHIDAMIYTDTDTLFLGAADELWTHFNNFSSDQIAAMALEDSIANVAWYPRFADHPFYGKYGLNSGVMLMNLTRMRSFHWTDYVTPIMLKWKQVIPWGDQDIINIIFHYHDNAVLELSCRFNYRTDHCMYGDACADGSSRGALLLHGNRAVFHTDKHPSFQAVYRAMEEYELGSDPSTFLSKLYQYLEQAPGSKCGNLTDVFRKVPTQYIHNPTL